MTKVAGVLLGIGLMGVALWWFSERDMNEAIIAPSVQDVEESPVPAGMELYRNEEFGFEFMRPDSWELEEGTFYSPFSKINLVVRLPGDNNLVLNSFMINIVTVDFAENAAKSKKSRGARESSVSVSGSEGTKYEYEMDGSLNAVSVDIPFGEYRMLLVADRKHEATFNAILESFRFLPSTATR